MSIKSVSLQKFYTATDCYAVNIMHADADGDSIVTKAEVDAYLSTKPNTPASMDKKAEAAGTLAFFAFACREQKSTTVSIGLTKRDNYRVFESWAKAQQIVAEADTNGDKQIDSCERSKLSTGMRQILDCASRYADFY